MALVCVLLALRHVGRGIRTLLNYSWIEALLGQFCDSGLRDHRETGKVLFGGREFTFITHANEPDLGPGNNCGHTEQPFAGFGCVPPGTTRAGRVEDRREFK